MARKTHFAGFAASIATLGMTFAGADLSGAYAQQSVEKEKTSIGNAAPDAPEPEFVSQEVVQPLPPEVELADADAGAKAADGAQPEGFSGARAASLHELVEQTDTTYTLSREMECLAGTVYFEARGEPIAGQLAVAQVVINRAQSAQFPSSYCGVVFQRSQFSFVKGGQFPNIRRNSDAWKRAKAIARIAHEGHWQSEAGDALYFHANYVRPSWSRTKSRRAAISTHIFYR